MTTEVIPQDPPTPPPTESKKPNTPEKPSAKDTSPEHSNPSHMTCINPATGETIRELPIATKQDVEAAVEAARLAFEQWSRFTIERRCHFLQRARDIMLDRKAEILDLLVEETGKVRTDALADILFICETIDYYCNKGPGYIADRTVKGKLIANKRVRVEYMSRGLVANISPWNYPLDLAWSPLIPALVAGNVVINKPSEVTPLISLKFHECLMDAGIPQGVAQVLIGYGDVGAELIQHADFVAFTGSVATGRKVAKACAERLIPCTLELGGKDPAIVLEDADIERSANGVVWGSFFNSGQTCVSIERVYVVEDIYDEFVDAVVRLTQSLRQGIDTDFNTDIGSMIFPKQLEIVEAHVQDAIDKGATLRTGGRRNPDFASGNFYEPTVLTDVTDDMLIMNDETFGPILPIMKVRDAEEALRRANDSPYGLNSSVWTDDNERGRAIARRLVSGNVCINEALCNYMATDAPFGGVKHSGIGRRKGAAEIRKYCHEKTVLEDIFKTSKEPFWYPYSPMIGEGIFKSLNLLYRSGIGNKIRGLLS